MCSLLQSIFRQRVADLLGFIPRITDLNISAYDLGQAIETLIRKKLHLINAEIEKL